MLSFQPVLLNDDALPPQELDTSSGNQKSDIDPATGANVAALVQEGERKAALREKREAAWKLGKKIVLFGGIGVAAVLGIAYLRR